MADKVKQEWLLTSEEIAQILGFKTAITVIPYSGKQRDLTKLTQAQLAKAEPLIRQDERERIGQLLTNIGYYEKVTDFIAEIQGQEEDEGIFHTLKGKGKGE